MESMQLKIDKLNEKVKHISVLTSSITGSLIPFKKKNNCFMDKEETHVMVKELQNLNKNAQIIQTWVNDTGLDEKICTPKAFSGRTSKN